MTNLQIQSLTWEKEGSSFLETLTFRDHSVNNFSKVPLTDYFFKFNLTNTKFCTGYSYGGEFIECKFKNQIFNTATVCSYCENLQGFKSSFIFGDLTHSKSTEILSQDYYIYLAYFEPGIIKVGTANASRANLRLIEQDALIYAFIAKGVGFKIQKLENLISKRMGITEFVNSKHKFKYLSVKPNESFAKEKINSIFKKVVAEFSNNEEYGDLFFNEVKIENFEDSLNLYFPESVKKVEDLNLFGKFKGIRGKYLLLENQDTIYAFDTNYLVGRTINNYIEDYIYPNADLQISLL